MKRTFVAFVMLASGLLMSCSDSISRSYATLKEAQEDMAKGWIPPILPPSAHSIRDSHDLDSNMGDGTFRFAPNEFDILVNGTSPRSPGTSRGVPSSQSMEKWKAEGFVIREYLDGDTLFVIAAHPSGEGRYWMALQR